MLIKHSAHGVSPCELPLPSISDHSRINLEARPEGTERNPCLAESPENWLRALSSVGRAADFWSKVLGSSTRGLTNAALS